MKNPKQKISHNPWVLPLHLLEWVSWPVAHTPCSPWESLLSPQLWGALPWTSGQQMLGLQQRWPVPGGLVSSCGGLGVLLQRLRSAAGEPACCPDPVHCFMDRKWIKPWAMNVAVGWGCSSDIPCLTYPAGQSSVASGPAVISDRQIGVVPCYVCIKHEWSLTWNKTFWLKR